MNAKKPDIIAEDACLYRYKIKDNRLDVFEHVIISGKQSDKRVSAYFDNKQVFVCPRPCLDYLDGGYLRFWMFERDDKDARDIVKTVIDCDRFSRISDLYDLINMYERQIEAAKHVTVVDQSQRSRDNLKTVIERYNNKINS